VVFGENAAGECSRTGGWGYVFGDEGSGFGLAREGVRAALDALDGVGPETTLVQVLTEKFGVSDLRLLPMVMYNGHISRDAVASAAREVIATWQAGDAVAARVVADGLDALARRVRSVATPLHPVQLLARLSGSLFGSPPFGTPAKLIGPLLMSTASFNKARAL